VYSSTGVEVPAVDQGLAQSKNRYHLVPRTLSFVVSGNEVLLLKGAPNKKIWPGKYNGLGGHVERGESIYTAAEREIREEAGLTVSDLRLRGVITIETGEAIGIGLFVFTAVARSRDVIPSTEGSLEWISIERLTELDLVEDLPLLLPRALAMKPTDPCFSAQYTYDAEGKLVIEFFEGE
jgi:8-oxo-dGTP diphosphatase